MFDHDPKKTLSEISHLFLSSIRDKQTNGVPRPLRTPPQAPAAPAGPAEQGLPAREPGGPWSGMHVDSSPGEMAPAQPAVQLRSVSAVIAAHLNGKQFDRVKDYARH